MMGHDPSIAPVNDYPGNQAAQSMHAQLAAVTAAERNRG